MPSPQVAIMPDDADDDLAGGSLLQTAANSPAPAKLLSATIAARKAKAKVTKAPLEQHWSAGESDLAAGASGLYLN
jgi:hypothetical protein